MEPARNVTALKTSERRRMAKNAEESEGKEEGDIMPILQFSLPYFFLKKQSNQMIMHGLYMAIVLKDTKTARSRQIGDGANQEKLINCVFWNQLRDGTS